MLDWLIQNKEWVFGGVGVAIITGVVGFLKRSSTGVNQSQHSGSNSTNVQSGRDVNLNKGSSKPDDG